MVSACRTPSGGGTPLGVELGKPDVAGFAWTNGDLPACYGERFGRSVFVYDQQRSLQCNQSKSTWK